MKCNANQFITFVFVDCWGIFSLIKKWNSRLFVSLDVSKLTNQASVQLFSAGFLKPTLRTHFPPHFSCLCSLWKNVQVWTSDRPDGHVFGWRYNIYIQLGFPSKVRHLPFEIKSDILSEEIRAAQSVKNVLWVHFSKINLQWQTTFYTPALL